MTTSACPAVERVQPPKAPFDGVNRVVGWFLAGPRRASRLGRHLLLLHVTGRLSGLVLDVPVSYRRHTDGRLLVLTSSRWRVNLRDRPDVEVTLHGVRRPARAELVEDVDAVADVYAALIEEVGPRQASRRLGVRVNLDRVPTHAELVEAARRDHLALVLLDVHDGLHVLDGPDA